MNRFLYLGFLWLIPTLLWGQADEKKIISDSTYIICAVVKTATVYKEPSLVSDDLSTFEPGYTMAVVFHEKSALDYLYVTDGTISGYVPLMDVAVDEEELAYLKQRGVSGKEVRQGVASHVAKLLITVRERKAAEVAQKKQAYTRQGLLVTDWSFTEPDDVVGGVDVKIQILNPVKKKVKYAWFTLAAYNAVGDRTGDRIHGLKPITLKGVGPVEQWEGGGWEFEHVWYNGTIDCVRITQIKIQYMDGSIRVFDKPNLVLAEGLGNSCKY